MVGFQGAGAGTQRHVIKFSIGLGAVLHWWCHRFQFCWHSALMGSWCIRLGRGVLVRQILTSWKNRSNDEDHFWTVLVSVQYSPPVRTLPMHTRGQSLGLPIRVVLFGLFVVLVCFVFMGYPSMLQFQCLVWSAKIEKLDPKEANQNVAVWFVCVFRFFLYITASFLKLETFLYCRDFLVVTILTVKKSKMFHPIRSDCRHFNCMCHFSTEENF